MKKNTLNFWVDMMLFCLLILTVLAVPPEALTHSMVHVVPGLLLIGGVGVHLWLHRSWIVSSARRYASLSAQARRAIWLNAALLGVYLACAAMGLTARSHLADNFELHIHFGLRHVFLALLLIVLQITHIARHWKWITATCRRVFRSGVTPRPA
jgi:hypothetical protein